jgi:hypothetical protein
LLSTDQTAAECIDHADEIRQAVATSWNVCRWVNSCIVPRIEHEGVG